MPSWNTLSVHPEGNYRFIISYPPSRTTLTGRTAGKSKNPIALQPHRKESSKTTCQFCKATLQSQTLDKPTTTSLTETSPPYMKFKPTDMVKVMGKGDQHLNCRVLLDNCSDEYFSSYLVTRPGLKCQRLSTPQNVQILQGEGVAAINAATQIKLT
ncbi:unnamed protein product [Allacma fusca]|uniref:Uncharacterized protein n=1 Tax=Allacma fusca TaxID=39272 RepID=A0A8J2JVN2_9HEXA|nr:unnamed protein product [Allacma fusca]